MDCKVVYGCCATGFTDVVGPLSYEDCVLYLRAHMEQVCFEDNEDPHYTETLDIMNAETGRLMSFTL